MQIDERIIKRAEPKCIIFQMYSGKIQPISVNLLGSMDRWQEGILRWQEGREETVKGQHWKPWDRKR